METVKGKDKGKLMLYALSTCVWCAKTKKLLNELGVAYTAEDVDLLDEKDAENLKTVFKKWDSTGFPLLIIDDKKCIKGFDEKEIKEAVK